MSVVTKSGTNQYHGALWEFLRNKDMDARGYFESTLPPLKQNQYGASAGGPVWIPKVYNGKNRTFFYAAWEGFRLRSAVTTGQLAPTDAMRSGDFSALGVPIYDPATTTLESRRPVRTRAPRSLTPLSPPTGSARSPRFSRHSSRHAGPLVNGNNVYSSGPAQTNQDSGTIRGDQNFGNNNQLMFRYSQFDQEVANTTDIVGLNTIHVYGHNYVGHWTHTFNPRAFSDVYFGRNYGDTITGTEFPGEDAGFLGQLQTLGMSKSWMTLNNKLYAPQWSADNYFSLSGSQLQETESGG